MRNIFLNFSSVDNTWKLDTVIEIISKVKDYCLLKGLSGVELYEVEDNTEKDPNQRYDVSIRYIRDGHLIQQKLLILKGEVLDGDAFHKRYEEFYK